MNEIVKNYRILLQKRLKILEEEYLLKKKRIEERYNSIKKETNSKTEILQNSIKQKEIITDLSILESEYKHFTFSEEQKFEFRKYKATIEDELNKIATTEILNINAKLQRSKKVEANSFKGKSAVFPTVIFFVGIFLLILSQLKPQKAELRLKASEIEATLRVEFSNEYFVSKKIPTNEKIKNKKGDYYKIDLKLADHKELILFPPGKFVLSSEKEDLVNSINNFRKTVYNYLDEQYGAEIYVKGTADITGNTTFKDTLSKYMDMKNEKYIKFKIKPYDKVSDKFDNSSELDSVNEIYENANLPNLRAKFIQKLIVESNPEWEAPEILQGSISNEISERERNAYLILFVNKADKNKKSFGTEVVLYVSIALILISLFWYYYVYFKK